MQDRLLKKVAHYQARPHNPTRRSASPLGPEALVRGKSQSSLVSVFDLDRQLGDRGPHHLAHHRRQMGGPAGHSANGRHTSLAFYNKAGYEQLQ